MAIVKQDTYGNGNVKYGYNRSTKKVKINSSYGNNYKKKKTDSALNMNYDMKTISRKMPSAKNTIYRNGKPATIGGNYTLKSYNDFPKRVSSSRKGGNY